MGPTAKSSSVNGVIQVNGNTEKANNSKVEYNDLGWKVQNERGYRILEEHFGTKRNLRIIHIGAGASGICLSKFATEMLEQVELQIYEKNSDIGGTWLENRYPGCACDIPSVCYQFPWARKPNWSHYYSGWDEILKYFQDLAKQVGTTRLVKFEHTVVGADWDSEEGLWYVKVKDAQGHEFTDTCNVLINGGGILNNWKWPDTKGLQSFKGILQHSAHYDESLDLTGKRVAVIGIGSSGTQIISSIAQKVERLYTWIRTPTWITAAFAQRFSGPDGANFSYSDKQKAMLAKDPELMKKYSKMIESELNQRFKFILNNTEAAKAAREDATAGMTKKLADKPEILEAILPKNFGVGCRRPTPGNGFLEALNRPNVTAYTEGLKQITSNGFIDPEGNEQEVDVIICATGFNTSWIPRFPVVANGTSVAEMWKERASAYLSVSVPNMPNYYLLGGPYGPHAHGSFLPIMDTTVKYILQIVQKMQQDRIKSLKPKNELVEAFREHADLYLTRTAWSSGCTSWFKQGRMDGPLALFPGTRIMFLELLEKPRLEHYDIEYCNPLNPFEFLRTGFSVREFDGRDLSWYLGLVNGEDKQVDLEGELANELESLIPSARRQTACMPAYIDTGYSESSKFKGKSLLKWIMDILVQGRQHL